MKKIILSLASAGLIATLPAQVRAGELEDMKQSLQKMQERINQLESQQQETRKAVEARPASSTVPVLSGTALGGNPSAALYGKLDVFVEYNTGGDKGSRTAIQSGGLNGSRLGVKGGADIADGIRGIYQLEAGFFADKGTLAQGGRMFGRQAYAGIESASYGRLTIGRQYSPMYNAIIAHDAFEQGYGSPTTDGNVSTGATRYDSSLVYTSPKLGGLTASAMVALGGETGKSSGAYALALAYSIGDLTLTGAYQEDDHITSTTGRSKNSFIGANYKLGKTQLLAGYGHVENEPDNATTTKRDEWMIGSRSAVTGTGQLLFAYGEGKTRDKNPNDKAQVATLGWVESLSPQSRVYGILSAHKNSTGSALVPMGTSSASSYTINPGNNAYGLALGYQYSF